MAAVFINVKIPKRAYSDVTILRKEICQTTNYTYRHVKFGNEKTVVYTHNNCQCNQMAALQHRHQVESPKVDLEINYGWCNKWLSPYRMLTGDKIPEVCKMVNSSLCNRFVNMLLDLYDCKHTLLKRKEVIMKYKGQKRRKYYGAFLSLKEKPLNVARDGTVRMFVKADKETSYLEKAPRAIQYRSPRIMLEMGRYVHAFESNIYKTCDKYGTLIFAKGLNPKDMATQMKNKWLSVRSPVILLLDASRFDSCVDVTLLQGLMHYYKCLFPKDKQYVARLAHCQMVLKGYTSHGLKFKTWGTRASGDMDTGLGNSLIMYVILQLYMEVLNCNEYSLFINGDDSCIFLPVEYLSKANDLCVEFFLRLGFNMKFEWSSVLEQADFCQCKYVDTEYGGVMVRNPLRIRKRIGWSLVNYSKKNIANYFYTIVLGELAMHWGTPVWGVIFYNAFKKYFWNSSRKFLDLNEYNKDVYEEMILKFKHYRNRIMMVTQESRLSFAKAWGLSVEEQLAWESKSVEPNYLGVTDLLDDYDYLTRI